MKNIEEAKGRLIKAQFALIDAHEKVKAAEREQVFAGRALAEAEAEALRLRDEERCVAWVELHAIANELRERAELGALTSGVWERIELALARVALAGGRA